ncbi:hypothetical protein [Sporomusa malonica]|nr:hypothetical protein [Sporomusa malonica]
MSKVERIEEATHWLSKENNAKARVKKYTAYKLFAMPDSFFGSDDEEYWIMDDDGNASMAFLVVKGVFLKHSYDFILKLTEKEFSNMSVEAKRQFSYTFDKNLWSE